MEHFVTLLDKLFLPQGLALHISMVRNVKAFKLWILCVDDEAYNLLDRLTLDHVHLLKFSDLETDSLLGVKSGRTKGEYCWTLTPFAPRFVFEADSTVKRITYIDADLWFRKDPQPIFEEFDASKKSVLITDHAYAPEFDQSNTSGQYCVQFMTFDRKQGEIVRKHWEESCIDWCYARFEDGKFGDQKYLDTWPSQFSKYVHVLANKELCLMPWNATRFPYGHAVFYHFHGLRLLSENTVDIGGYPLPKVVHQNVYEPYLRDLRKAINLMKSQNFSIRRQASRTTMIRNTLKRFYSIFLWVKHSILGYKRTF